ncbi:O-antigen ligase family protein [Paraclostridium sordellii]|uniref:O-antigen ligase family protein n=1 Tax=Paraclostridium sordellii TaxID=1505 RepID=UPI001897B9F2|nr:hypothetical protein [Paeniclostridium sordellii]
MSTVILYFIGRKKILINEKVFKFILVVSIVYFFCPISSFNIETDTVLYYVFTICFIIVSYIGGTILNEDKNKTINYMIISNSIPLLYQIVVNIDQININTVMSVFTGDRINRATFGYSHANFTAMFIVLEILLMYFRIKKVKKSKLMNLLMIFLLGPLLSTGSRSGVYALIVFLISEAFFIFSSKFNKYKNLVYSTLIISLSIFFVLNFGESLVLNSSGRDEILVNNFRVLKDNGYLIFGAGGGSTSNINSIEGIRFSDNWYMTNIINSGIIGLTLMLLFITFIFIRIFKNKINDTIGISFFIMMYVYSLSENMLFVPGVALSWFLWTYVMYAFQTIEVNRLSKICLRGN